MLRNNYAALIAISALSASEMFGGRTILQSESPKTKELTAEDLIKIAKARERREARALKRKAQS